MKTIRYNASLGRLLMWKKGRAGDSLEKGGIEKLVISIKSRN